MAGKKTNDAIEIDALLTPELGDMGKVEKELSKILSNAAKPLVDTISNAKVGLDPAALKKVQRQLDSLAKDFGDGFDESVSRVLGEQNKNLRSAKGLRQLAKADSGIAMKALKVDGGACANNYLMQTMADISNLPVERPCCVETTALGAAYLAGLAVGYWSSTDEVVKNWSVDRTFLPQITAEERTKRIKGWNKAVRCSYHWALDEEES